MSSNKIAPEPQDDGQSSLNNNNNNNSTNNNVKDNNNNNNISNNTELNLENDVNDFVIAVPVITPSSPHHTQKIQSEKEDHLPTYKADNIAESNNSMEIEQTEDPNTFVEESGYTSYEADDGTRELSRLENIFITLDDFFSALLKPLATTAQVPSIMDEASWKKSKDMLTSGLAIDGLIEDKKGKTKLLYRSLLKKSLFKILAGVYLICLVSKAQKGSLKMVMMKKRQMLYQRRPLTKEDFFQRQI
jgi:hypothetical protein